MVWVSTRRRLMQQSPQKSWGRPTVGVEEVIPLGGYVDRVPSLHHNGQLEELILGWLHPSSGRYDARSSAP